MYNVNVKGPFLGTKYALPVMKKDWRRIDHQHVVRLRSDRPHVHARSLHDDQGRGVTLLTRAVAARYGKFNIRCNSINPSTADTPLVREMLKDR